MVYLYDLEARTSAETTAESVFLKAPKGKPSIKLEIIWEDKEFKKLYPENKTFPMKIDIQLPEVKLYCYDLDYCTLCKFF